MWSVFFLLQRVICLLPLDVKCVRNHGIIRNAYIVVTPNVPTLLKCSLSLRESRIAFTQIEMTRGEDCRNTAMCKILLHCDRFYCTKVVRQSPPKIYDVFISNVH